MTQSRPAPVILCIVNRRGWAHDRKTDALTAALGKQYNIIKRFQEEVSVDDIERADCILIYFWLQLQNLNAVREALYRRRDRIVMGICSHYELQGDWRSPGLEALNDLARAVFVNNKLLLREFAPLLTRPVFYTPNGVDTKFFEPAQFAPRPDTLRVGWAGSLENHTPAHRGVHEVIAPGVAAVGGAELHLAAREQYWRNKDEMRAFYQLLDVYVCASASEGTPNGCLEAAACGVPVVSTYVGNMPEFIRNGENGFCIERNAADLAAKLKRLRDDVELRRRLGQAARETSIEWDWHGQALHYDRMLRTIVGSTG